MRFPAKSKLQVDFPQIRDFSDDVEVKRVLVWMREITTVVNRLAMLLAAPTLPGKLPASDFTPAVYYGNATFELSVLNLPKKAAKNAPVFAFRNGLASIRDVHYTIYYAPAYTQITLKVPLRETDNFMVYFKEESK